MRTKILFVACLIFSLNVKNHAAFSQQYKGAVGLRFGYGLGITGVYVLDQRKGYAIEMLLRYGYHGVVINRPGGNFQVMFEKHWEFGRNGNFSGFAGAGPAIGVGKKTFGATQTYFALGVSPIVGIDYTTQNLHVPFILAIDYKPTLYGDFPIASKKNANTKSEFNFSYYEIAFSVRIGIGR